jgi:CheY-like chemotaxis protein
MHDNPLSPRPTRIANTNTVVVAEDDGSTRSFLGKGLRGLNGWEVVMAKDGQEAYDFIVQNQVDVLVTDLQMPIMDGYQLIAQVSTRYPHIPIIVVTGIPAEKQMTDPIRLGAITLFNKPPRLSLIMDEIRRVAAHPPAASIRGVSLQTILQALKWEQKSCTMVVKGDHGMGLLYLQEGELVNAAFKELEGLEAVFRVLAWRQVQVDIVASCKVDRAFEQSLESILLDAAVALDRGQIDPSYF